MGVVVVTTEPQKFHIERVLQNGEQTVTVRLGMPRPNPGDPEEWLCAFQITGIGRQAVHLVSGVDGFAALFVALGTIAVHLRTAPGTELSWLGTSDLGFPIIFGPRADRDFLQFTDAPGTTTILRTEAQRAPGNSPFGPRTPTATTVPVAMPMRDSIASF
ncbi:MAG: hypothetical protein IT303_08480 [Dehalococcoidia bacterium]|nr:hypothetical protein [Dehalococcoidia bacterium]